MRVPLTQDVLDEVERFQLRSSCQDCFFHVARTGLCAHEWPNEQQRRWPPEAPREDGSAGPDLHLCKEFELR